ncbi:MAG: MobC family plasmid mobilization relaxosome protein [Eubacterium sp.]|nr:MobC family plasmid mobilization relaxosome protein [Eubacterium sp.]
MKEKVIALRLSKNEYKKLLSLAAEDPECLMKQSGRPSLSSYIRKCIFCSGDHPENLKKEIRSLTYQVRKAGVNINQAVHWINAGYGSEGKLREILENQRRIEELLIKILGLMSGETDEGRESEEDGDHKDEPS